MRTIVVDTREQRPWRFPEWVDVRRGTLRTGDYALDGDDGFAVERKSLDDFLGTIFSGWARFTRELERMENAGFAARVIIVESDFAAFCFAEDRAEAEHSHYRITPQAVMARVAELAFMNVTVLFCGDKSLAAGMAYALLAKRNEQLERERWNA